MSGPFLARGNVESGTSRKQLGRGSLIMGRLVRGYAGDALTLLSGGQTVGSKMS